MSYDSISIVPGVAYSQTASMVGGRKLRRRNERCICAKAGAATGWKIHFASQTDAYINGLTV